MNLSTTALTFALLTAAPFVQPALAQGDDCSMATPLNATGLYPFNSLLATTSGFDGGGSCVAGASAINQDVFWDFTAPNAGTYVIDTDGYNFDTKLAVHSGVGCAATCADYNDDFFDLRLRSRVVLRNVAVGDRFLIQVGGFGTDAGLGRMNIHYTEVVQGGDTCGAAVTFPAGVDTVEFDTTSATTSFFDGGGSCDPGSATLEQDLFWEYVVPQTGLYRFDTIGSAFDTQLSVHRGAGCAATCADYNDDSYRIRSYIGVVDANAGDVLLIQVGGYPGATGGSFGAGFLSIHIDPCGIFPQDIFEDNDECATATPLADGLYPGLTSFENDDDWFELTIDPGATVVATIYFTNAIADVDTELYLADGTCGLNNRVATGFSTTDDEVVSFMNTGGVVETLLFRVNMFTSGACAPYDMEISGSSGGFLHTNYCNANPNSTGLSATISGAGSNVASLNDVTLTVDRMPQNSFGFFLTSPAMGFIQNPGGSAGNLCLSGAIGRYVGPGQIQNSGSSGSISLVLDLTQVPTPTGFVTVQPGSTWYFTSWFRDAVGGSATSNFSDGFGATFN